MGKVKSISEVIIRLAGKLQGSATLCNIVRRFSTVARGVKVVVGGYASGVLTEDDAPFIWIYPDDSEFSCTGGFVKSFKAKIVVGVCPKKDAPSATDTINAYSNAVEACWGPVIGSSSAKQDCFRGLDYGEPSEVEPLKTRYEEQELSISSNYNSSKTAVSDAEEYIEKADIESANTKWMEADSKFTAIKISTDDIAGICMYASNCAAAAGETELAVSIRTRVYALESDSARIGEAGNEAADKRRAIMEKYTEWIDDPYVTETVAARGDNSNGLVIFGSLRQFDAIRTAIYDIVKENDCGLIVDGFDCRCNSASHFPLDWTEATVSFSEQPAL